MLALKDNPAGQLKMPSRRQAEKKSDDQADLVVGYHRPRICGSRVPV